MPLLPPELVRRYSAALAVTPQLEVAKRGAMPQWLGDKRGWHELVDATVAVYRTLPADEQRRTIVFGADYGMAGALELWGPASGLRSQVISTHDEFWARGPGPVREAILLGSLRAATSRFMGGPDGEAQFTAARRVLGPSAIVVDVMYARGIAVARQDRRLFLRLLDGALAADLSRWPDRRLPNEMARIKAQRYRAAVDALIPAPSSRPSR